ncbi:MAG TPA: sulfur carrier protein ThiS [Geobacteraceae bacterium]
MQLTVNGKPASIAERSTLTVSELLEELKVPQREYVTVELNGDILERSDFDSITVSEGAAVEFLYFMGGGN